jgi:hypothetical protein
VRIRGVNRQAVLNLFRRDMKDIAYRTSPQSKKRQRSISFESSSSDKLGPSNYLPPSRKKIVLSLLTRNYSFSRHRRLYYFSPNNLSNGLIFTGKKRFLPMPCINLAVLIRF